MSVVYIVEVVVSKQLPSITIGKYIDTLICNIIRGGRWIIEALRKYHSLIEISDTVCGEVAMQRIPYLFISFFCKKHWRRRQIYSTLQSFNNSPSLLIYSIVTMSETAEVDDKPNWLQSNAEEGYGTQSKYQLFLFFCAYIMNI